MSYLDIHQIELKKAAEAGMLRYFPICKPGQTQGIDNCVTADYAKGLGAGMANIISTPPGILREQINCLNQKVGTDGMGNQKWVVQCLTRTRIPDQG